MWFESLLVFILFKFKKRPNISGIQVVINTLLNVIQNKSQNYFCTVLYSMLYYVVMI